MQNNQTQKTFNLREMCKLIADGTDPARIEWTWGYQRTWYVLSDDSITGNPFTTENNIFRLKQKMVTVNGFVIPAPLDKVPEEDELFFFPVLQYEDFYDSNRWDGDKYDMRVFERGILHSTKENASMHAKALLGIDPYKED
jgi:hypothetical protein